MALRRSKEHAFLHIVEKLAVPALSLAAIGDVLQHVDGLQPFIERTADARGGNQVASLQDRMNKFIRIPFIATEGARMRGTGLQRYQRVHATPYQIRGWDAYRLGQRA